MAHHLSLHTTLIDTSSSGAGELLRICVTQRVHSGPKSTMDKLACLVMNQNEAFDLVIGVLGKLPAIPIGIDQDKFNRLKRLFNAIPVSEEIK